MRIIAGLYRGRTLRTLQGLELRPTPDRLREALFDVLGSSVQGSVFVDAYAGSGAVGLEAASRGARHVYLIEENAAAVRVIRHNIAALGIGERAEVVRTLVRRGLRLLEQRGVRADFCFLDPPYADLREYRRCLQWLSEGELMVPAGLIIVQHSRREMVEERVGRWRRARLLVQGSNALGFYRATADATFLN